VTATSAATFGDEVSSPAARLFNAGAGSRVVLVCEHASNHIPPEYSGLGLSPAEKTSHVAWDIGARGLSERLSEKLDAVLIEGAVSRLVYDCNRPPTAADAMPAKSEQIVVPGNQSLTAQDREMRTRAIYEPFRKRLSDTIHAMRGRSILITVHSFTPVYFGKYRAVEVGIIHHADDRLAKAMVRHSAAMSDLKFALNEPYSQADGVAHTLMLHGTENGLVNAMIEVRNDLLETSEQQEAIADMLARLIRISLSDMNEPLYAEGQA
jgi:predicted N-formylglutamate amidohydrolase